MVSRCTLVMIVSLAVACLAGRALSVPTRERRNAAGCGCVEAVAAGRPAPWAVKIVGKSVSRNRNEEVTQCAGSLIHKQAVLTSAHCVSWVESAEIRVQAVGTGKTSTIDRIVVNENFKKEGIPHDDLALVFLTEELAGSDEELLCLPSSGQDAFKDDQCFSTAVFDDKDPQDAKFRLVDSSVVELSECRETLKALTSDSLMEINEGSLCATVDEKDDSCTDNTGSSFVCLAGSGSERSYVQAGIVSWRLGCEGKTLPTIHTNVGHFSSWIQDNIKKHFE